MCSWWLWEVKSVIAVHLLCMLCGVGCVFGVMGAVACLNGP